MKWHSDTFKKIYNNWILFKNPFTIGVFIFFMLMLLNPLYVAPMQKLYSERVLDEKVKVLSEELWANSDSEEEYILSVLQWQNQSMRNVYGRRGLFTIDNFHIRIFPPTFCLRLNGEEAPSWVFKSRCGACGEYALFFREVVKYSPVPVRSVHNPGDDHVWAEVFINGEWVVVDPSVIAYNQSRENYASRSYIYALYPNGTSEPITEQYRSVGELRIINNGQETIEVAVTRNSVRAHQTIGVNCSLSVGEGCNAVLGNTTYTIIGMTKGIIKRAQVTDVNITANDTNYVEFGDYEFSLYFTLNTINPILFRVLFAICAWWLVGLIISFELSFKKLNDKK